MIKIEIRKPNKVNGDFSSFISFPFDNSLLGLVKSFPERYWDKETKEWELPIKYVDRFIGQCLDEKIQIDFLDGSLESPEKPLISKIDFDFKTEPFTHQMEGMIYGLNNDCFLLGDEMGLGKTKQVIDIACYKKQNNGFKHCLIVCGVNGLKWSWKSEIETHSNESAYILGSRRKKGKLVVGSLKDRLGALDNLPEDYFIITNIETLRESSSKKSEMTISKKIKQLINDGEINMIAVDEIHKLKNPTSQQFKGLIKLQPECRIAMTGTPLMNNPLDLYVILKWLGVENHSFYQFKNHYCEFGGYGGYEIMGYKNLNYLKEDLDANTLRRKKNEVFDLPEKLPQIEYVEMSAKQAGIYAEIKADILSNIDLVRANPNPLAQLIRLRQATGYTGILSTEVKESAKLDRMEELVEEYISNGEKVIIFSNWTSITDEAKKRLSKYGVAVITGQTKDQDRKAEEMKFMTDENCKVIIGTIGAMGTGLTLTAASVEIFLDDPWNRANKEQAEDRAHRIGTAKALNVITLITKDTIDERINELVYKKGKMADLIIDGEVTKITPDVINELLR